MDVDYADEVALLANTPVLTESLSHSVERSTGGIRLHVNEDKTEYKCFNQSGNISTSNGDSLKLVKSSTTSEAASYLQKSYQFISKGKNSHR